MKWRNIALLVVTFLIIGAAAKVAQNREVGRLKRLASQENFLNLRFSSVQPKNGRVIMTAKNIFFPAFDYHQTRSFLVGDSFEYHDHHWNGHYTIQEIKPDGVKISLNSSIPWGGNVSGTVKIGWK